MDAFLIKTIRNLINVTSYFSPRYAGHLAIKLFSTPLKGKLSKKEETYLNTAAQEDIYYKNFKLKTYRWGGKKETILLLHGWESNSYRWKELIEFLNKDGYNIITLDAPAHGASGSKIFNAVLYSECIHEVTRHFKIDVMIGHSIGGTTCALSIYTNSTPVKKLVMLGSPSNFARLVSNYTNTMKYNQRVLKAMSKNFIKNFGNLPDYYNATLFATNIDAECLIIHDKKDRIISIKDGIENKNAFKNSVFFKTNGLGHPLKSKEVYHHILDFLNA